MFQQDPHSSSNTCIMSICKVKIKEKPILNITAKLWV